MAKAHVQSRTLRYATDWRANLPPPAFGRVRNRASAVVVAEMTAEASKPEGIAKWADAAVVEILAETATPLIADLESDAIALVAKIVGLQTAAGLARDIAERRRPRVLTVEEHAMRNIGKGVAIQHAELEDGKPPEARVAVGALTERLGPGVWAKISAAIIDALHTRHADISEKVSRDGRLMARV